MHQGAHTAGQTQRGNQGEPMSPVAQPTGKSDEALPLARDCFVFLPGMVGGLALTQKIDTLCRRIARALANNAEDRTIRFSYKVHALENLETFKGEIGTIYRHDDQGDAPVIDVYMLEYRQNLIERYENRNLLAKTLLLLVALPRSVTRILRAMIKKKTSKTRPEQLQLLYALSIICLLIVYVAILIGALGSLIVDSHVLANVLPQIKFPQFFGWFSKASQWTVVVGAVLLLFLPPKFNFKERISQAAVDYLCMVYYLNLGDQRNTIVGRLETFIDEISRVSETERKSSGKGYRNIHLFSYSFGSIIALDALFPAGRSPGRPLRDIHTLVTIGCPFDFVRTFWSRYFDQRREYVKDHPVRWLNVYSPLDVLASNFRNDSQTSKATISIRAQELSADADVPAPCNVRFHEGLDHSELSFSDSLTLLGLRAHSMYWSSEAETEHNCFSELIPKMYNGR